MKRSLSTLILLWLGTAVATAQSDSTTGSICGSTLLQARQRQQNLQLGQQLQQSEIATQRRLSKAQNAEVAGTVHTLPVVVHVIHNGEGIGTTNNPSDAVIQAMIAGLNNAFRRNGPQFGGADIGIQLQLAVRSPQCGSTTGINRVNGSAVPNYASGGMAIGTQSGSADEVAVKSLSRWSNTDYVNIWIVNKINGNPFIGGFAYFPEYNSASTDGLVIIAATLGATNKTVVHEMGHYFNLHHTFHDESGLETDCPSLTACASTGDFICDTEPVINLPCNTARNPCTNAPFQVVDASKNYTVQNNYMGYTSCQWLFTQNQKERMRDALLTFRAGLITSDALQPTDSGAPTVACSVTTAYGLSLYYGVGRVTLNDLDIYSNSSESDGALYVDRTCNQRTTLVPGQTYTLKVEGTYDNTQHLRAFIDYNRDGDFTDSGETLLTGFAGSATATVGVPASGVMMNVPLRLRIVADNPDAPVPTACTVAGDALYGAGQIEDYTVVVGYRTVTSVASGSWSAPATWSCNCVPTATDLIAIQTGHIITIAAGLVQTPSLELSGRVQFGTGGRLRLAGN
ncbi:MAG: hypothetical protein H7Z72_10055 [Bacteroidetes bacterium]|nr:hypothetical protein [Fibrella sp.]